VSVHVLSIPGSFGKNYSSGSDFYRGVPAVDTGTQAVVDLDRCLPGDTGVIFGLAEIRCVPFTDLDRVSHATVDRSSP